jgi:hypothetical protein
VVLNHIKGFFCICSDDQVVFVFASLYVLHYIYRFVYVEPPLCPLDKANLVMVNGFSDMLLDSVCHYFIEDFASMFIKEVGLSFSFVDISLSNFGMSAMMV